MKKKFSAPGMLTGCASSLAIVAALMASQQVLAHGYMTEPPSRALLCKDKMNLGCEAAGSEPQSTGETYKGFPAGAGGAEHQGPIDGQIPSGSNSRFSALDAQSADRWHKTEVSQRDIAFNWFYTAAHPATKHEYFITRNGWNPNEVLKRSTFEPAPFCMVEGNERPPADSHYGPAREKHNCVIPEDKTGHHVILGVWTVGDTAMAFHDPVDVDITIEATTPDGWVNIGSIVPEQTLLAGDKVKARAFSRTGELTDYSVEINIDNDEEGLPGNWSYKLADAVNKAQPLIRFGIRGEDGKIEPAKGANKLYAQAESEVVRYEIQQLLQEDAQAELKLSPLGDNLELVKGRMNLVVPVVGNRSMNLEVKVFNAANKAVGSIKQTVGEGSSNLTVNVLSEPGAHQVVVMGTTVDGRTTRQDQSPVEFAGEGGGQEYDAVYPEGIADYQGGVKVLQPADDTVYECKPFPEGEWCRGATSHYAPGVGSDWQNAWNKLN